MKILLVTRGSQGDVLPYLAIAAELERRGHEVTINLPQIFEETVKPYGFKYVLQQFDDIGGMIDSAAQNSHKFRPFLKWMRNVIDKQFDQLIPLLKEHDILVSTNSEFAVASIAEYCKKPLMNRMTNFMVKDTINKNRAKYGLAPIRNFGYHAGERSYNYLLFSQHLGNIDPDWTFKWSIGGYCFNDTFQYDEKAYEEMISFVDSAQSPIIFFTLGSCSSKDGNRFSKALVDICKKHDYRLIIGSGWAKTGITLQADKHLFLMKQPVPHNLIFRHCDGVIHHGGCGTTHSVGRAGKPQLITPLIIDQPYWSYRIHQLGLGPEGLKIAKASEQEIERKVCDLVTNPLYKKNAAHIGEMIQKEGGIKNICDSIERFQ